MNFSFNIPAGLSVIYSGTITIKIHTLSTCPERAMKIPTFSDKKPRGMMRTFWQIQYKMTIDWLT